MFPSFSSTSFIAGVMAGVLVSSAWYFRGDIGLSTSASTVPGSTAREGERPTSTAVEVSDQPAGNVVTVDALTVPPPGVWVAVRDAGDERLGKVLGATRVGGPRSRIAVELLRATEPGLRYAVQLYRDDGGGGFDPGINSVYIDFDTGQPVIAYFATRE